MRKALLIGVNDYPGSPLAGCVHDATQLGAVLTANGDGSPNFDVQLMTSPSHTVDRASLRAAIEVLFTGDSEAALLFFSGHGYVDSTGGYLVTTDVTAYDEGVSMDQVLTIANQSEAKNKIVIVDCCHSGAFGTPAVAGGQLAQLSNGLTVLTASRGTEPAMEVNGQGVFTSLLIDALQGGAADLRGNITPGSLYAYVDEALGAWDQRPIFKTNVSSFVKLRTVIPKVPLEVLRRITDYFPDPNAEHLLDPSYEESEGTADPIKVAILKELQQLVAAALVVPVGESHMYYAAINSKSCKLTAVGYQYWRLAQEHKI